MSFSLNARASQSPSLRLTTVTSDTVIKSTIFEPSETATSSIPGTGGGSQTTSFSPPSISESVSQTPIVTEITVPTVIVITVTIPASDAPIVPESNPPGLSKPSSHAPSNHSSSPSSTPPSTLPSSSPSTSSVPSSQSSSHSSSSASSPPSSLADSSGSSNASHHVLIALATTLSLLAALIIAVGGLKCRRRLARAKVVSVDPSQARIKLEGSLEDQSSTCPSGGVSDPELEGARNSGSHADSEVQDGWPVVGSVSPFVKRYDSPRRSPSPDTSANIIIAMPRRKGRAKPSRPMRTGLGNPNRVEETAQDGTDGHNQQDLDDARRRHSIGHSTAPPPYSQIGEREA